MATRKTVKARRRLRVVRHAPPDKGPEWRLARRGPILAYDEYSDEEIELKLGQKDSSDIEGLLIDFHYISADGEMSRRSLLCWQCGRHANKIYVRGYCPFREELRTFRIDRMSDVVVFLGEREAPIEDVKSFFAAFAANAAADSVTLMLDEPEN
ncbi:MAG: WYL domain-containing protein [Rhizobiales bacterium]|nr:WYL domain-containing protein [Hyphomicrobiales bacterium]